MLQSYKSVMKIARAELEERKSRFIATCTPVETEADAAGFISRVQRTYPDASHHAFAWMLGRDLQMQRYSDAGEPQGTAGLPIMKVLQKNDLIQAAVVVTRYYGGIQLGAGGLGRAYSNSASLAVQAAEVASYQLCRQYNITVEYKFLARLLRYLEQTQYAFKMNHYGLDADVLVTVPLAEQEQMLTACSDITAGSALTEPLAELYWPLPPPDPPPGPYQTSN